MNKSHFPFLALLFLLPCFGLKASIPVDTIGNDLLRNSDEKISCCAKGVTVLDLIGISMHLQKLEPVENPHQLMAADVNQDRELTVLDLENLREFILGKQPPLSKLTTDESLSKSTKNQRFTSLNIGDVLSEADFKSEQPITLDPVFSLPDRHLCYSGQEVRFDLTVKNFEELRAFQFSLQWDAKMMEFLSIDNFHLDDFDSTDVGQQAAGKGLLSFAWFSQDTQGSTLDDGDAICSIHFRARRGRQGSTLISVAEKPTPVQVLHYNLSVANPIFETGSLTVESASPLSIQRKHVKGLSCSEKPSGSIDISVSGGSPPYVFEWNNGVATEDLTSLVEGQYAVTVTDAGGCSKQDAFTISDPNKIAANVEVTNTSGENQTDGALVINDISGGSPPYSFLWNNGVTTPSIFKLSPGKYFVTLTDAKECQHILKYEVGPLKLAKNIENTAVKVRLQSNPIEAGSPAILEFKSHHTLEAQLFLFQKEEKLIWKKTLAVQKGETIHSFHAPNSTGNYLLQIQLRGGGVKTLKFKVI